jgi:hypothetical protein
VDRAVEPAAQGGVLHHERREDLELVEHRTFNSGVVHLHRVAR